jgi:hypothetical protein
MKFLITKIILFALLVKINANLSKSMEPNSESKLVLEKLITEKPIRPSPSYVPQTSTDTPAYEQQQQQPQTASNEAQLIKDLEKGLARMKIKQMKKRPSVIRKKYLIPNENNFLFMFDDFNRFDLILRGGSRKNNQVLVEVKFRVVDEDFLPRQHKRNHLI